MDKDDWWGISLIVVSGVIIGVLAIPDIDIAFAPRVAFDEALGVIYFVASLAYFLLIRKRAGKRNESEDLTGIKHVADPSVREWSPELVSKLDPKFEHVYAILFYPPEITWESGKRKFWKVSPRYKVIVNISTNQGFWFAEYATDLLNRRAIQFYTTTGTDESAITEFLKKVSVTLVPRPATPSDLEKKG